MFTFLMMPDLGHVTNWEKTVRKFGDMTVVTSASPPEVNYHRR